MKFQKYNPSGVENIGLSGKIHFDKIDKNGQIVDSRDVKNLVVNDGLAAGAGLLNGEVTNYFEYIAIGTGTTGAAGADSALEHETHRNSATTSRETDSVTNDTATLVNTFNFTGSHTITESGILDSGTSGTLLCRQTFSAINVASGDSLQVTWKVTLS